MGLPRLRPALPAFGAGHPVVDPSRDRLSYNPTGEFIFPSLLDAGEHLGSAAIARWYLYTAPHERPGGVTLLTSDDLAGPWRQPFAHPLVPADWAPHFSVSHVSSPDVLWDPEASVLRLYFHGENDVTRVAESRDGVHFVYVGEAVTAAMVHAAQPGRAATEASYARVFPYPGPGPDRFGMFFMSNGTDDVRRIEVATSPDGVAWSVRDRPLVVPGPAEGRNVSSADLVLIGRRRYVAYGATAGAVFVRSVDRSLRRTGRPRRLYVPSDDGREHGRATAPQLVQAEDGSVRLFYEMGGRLTATIGTATATATAAAATGRTRRPRQP